MFGLYAGNLLKSGPMLIPPKDDVIPLIYPPTHNQVDGEC